MQKPCGRHTTPSVYFGGYDAQCMNYIENYAVTDAPNAAAKSAAAKLNLTDSIIKGLKDQGVSGNGRRTKDKRTDGDHQWGTGSGTGCSRTGI